MAQLPEPIKTNAANAPQKRVTEATRIPMSLPQLRLEIPEIPGFHLHWFLGKNISRALRAGYQYVDAEEVNAAVTGLADDPSWNGSTDMGTRVSVIAGGTAEGTNQPERLYLMKLPQEWRDKDVAALEAVNENVAKALRGGNAPAMNGGNSGETSEDVRRKYLKTGQDLFYPKVRKAPG